MESEPFKLRLWQRVQAIEMDISEKAVKKGNASRSKFLSLFVAVMLTASVFSIAASGETADPEEDTAVVGQPTTDKDPIIKEDLTSDTDDAAIPAASLGNEAVPTSDPIPELTTMGDYAALGAVPFAAGTTSVGQPLIPGGSWTLGDGRVAQLYQLFVNGNMVYCISPGLTFSGNETVVEDESYLNDNDRKRIAATIYFGHREFTGNDNISRVRQAITQAICWAVADGHITNESLDNYCGTLIGYLTANIWGGAQEYYDALKFNMIKAMTKPGFDGGSVELVWNEGNSRYEATLYDENLVLSRYSYTCPYGDVNFVRNGNYLLIHTTSNYRDYVTASARFTVPQGVITWVKPGDAKFQQTVQYRSDIAGYSIDSSFVFKTQSPDIKTNAIDEETQDHIANPDEEVTIIDTVNYSSLKPDNTYKVSGILMNATTGQPLMVDGQQVTAEKTFVATAVNGTINIEFTFDASALEGTRVVVFEDLYENGIKVATHSDINDMGQSVDFPKTGTVATDKETGEHKIGTDEVATIIDTVSYTNLLAGKEYTIKGVLMDKSTEEPLLTYEGDEVRAEIKFVAPAANGTVDLEFTFDAGLLYDKSIVVFETVYFKGIEVASHADINDEGQTVDTPEKPLIHTNATDTETEDHVAYADEEVTIIDAVTYEKLEVGKEYVIKGILMNKATNSPLLSDGQEVAAEKTFTPTMSDGTIEMEFVFDARALKGTSTVVFEYLEKNDLEVATHTDINDVGQTVEIPEIKTQASDRVDGDQTVVVDGTVTIVDKISYTNLLPGKEYVIKGILMDKGTNSPLIVNGQHVTAEKIFVPETAKGFVELEFTFDASALEGKTTVVFESFYYKGIEVATHADINDSAQTVNFVRKQTPKTGDALSGIACIVVIGAAACGAAGLHMRRKPTNGR